LAKLTKTEAKLHQQACDLLQKDDLTYDEKWFVYENWHEGAEHINSNSGAFFTPIELASDFRFDVHGPKVVDLCAGIGALSFAYYHWARHDTPPQITCIEINPAYVEVGKKLFPEANWICADIFEIWQELGHFDTAISNPPFGRIQKDSKAPRYTGAEFEFKVMDIAAHLADYGTFIVPQPSAGFRYSGAPYFTHDLSSKFKKFSAQTGIETDGNVGIDTTYYQEGWKGVSPLCEIVCCDFTEQQGRLFNSIPAPQPEQLTLL